MLSETRVSEEKAKKAMIDAARLADELRLEQENAQAKERDRRALDYQMKDMQAKLDEAEQVGIKLMLWLRFFFDRGKCNNFMIMTQLTPL